MGCTPYGIHAAFWFTQGMKLDRRYATRRMQAKVSRCVVSNVTDSKTGMPQVALDEIFKPFFITSKARNDVVEPVSPPLGNGEMVLVADDEASILTIASEILQTFGYRVLTAKDGADAVALYAQHQNEIAVVLTDMMMPVMDGAATINALRKINPAVKIVASSGIHANSTVAKASGVDGKHFLPKPYTPETLLMTIRAILEED
jgi:CheY-like chemotaxis protein